MGEMAYPWRTCGIIFVRYGLLDEQVEFLKTSSARRHPAAIDSQVDADLYGSTMDVLRSLYSKPSTGGYAIT